MEFVHIENENLASIDMKHHWSNGYLNYTHVLFKQKCEGKRERVCVYKRVRERKRVCENEMIGEREGERDIMCKREMIGKERGSFIGSKCVFICKRSHFYMRSYSHSCKWMKVKVFQFYSKCML